VLQLSLREGFEIKVSEALHKGKPVIATRTGGLPLQIQNGKSGWLVGVGDWKEVGRRMWELWESREGGDVWEGAKASREKRGNGGEGIYKRMCEYAAKSVSDEVGTVGNALSWFYLADKWAGGEGVVPEERWVNDLARGEAGMPYVEGENKLPRGTTVRG
jgi:alpha,alpha-trehalose phosphorylase (configuration-retaining)